MGLRSEVVALAKRRRGAVIAARIAKDRVAALGERLRVPIKRQGATHMGLPVEDSVAYVNAVFSDYVRYGALSGQDLEGAAVLELGPGDNLGVALRFVGAGARHVRTVDRFVTWRDPAQQERIYRALLESLSGDERQRMEAAISPGSPFGVDEAAIEAIQGVGAEEAAVGEARFDLIVSRAVLEHVNDLEGAFAAMDTLLRPGGLLVHKVDLGDHGLFSAGGHNPLTFLTVGARTYRWMGEHSGLPNRRLANWYRDEMARRGYEAQFFVTQTIGQDSEVTPHTHSIPAAELAAAKPLIDDVRPALPSRYRSLSDEDLATAGIFLVARKPKATVASR